MRNKNFYSFIKLTKLNTRINRNHSFGRVQHPRKHLRTKHSLSSGVRLYTTDYSIFNDLFLFWKLFSTLTCGCIPTFIILFLLLFSAPTGGAVLPHTGRDFFNTFPLSVENSTGQFKSATLFCLLVWVCLKKKGNIKFNYFILTHGI